MLQEPAACNQTKFAYKTGLFLLVHNQSHTKPFTLSSGINIPTGLETYVGVSRHFTHQLSSPYSNCLKNLKNSSIKYAQKLSEYFQELDVDYYHQDFCFTICFQDQLIEKCNCSDITTPTLRNVSYCSNDQEMNCFRGFNKYFKISDLNVQCESACPKECEIIKYDLSTSSATYPTLEYLKTLQSIYSHKIDSNDSTFFFPPQNVSDYELIEFARTSLIKVIINYDDLYYTSISETPKITFESFIGQLGGQLGIFMGFSLLSFIEILELGYHLFLVLKERF